VACLQIANVTYRVDIGDHGYGGNAAWLMVRDPRGGKRRLDLGNYRTVERAKQVCEQHYANGCDVGKARAMTVRPRLRTREQTEAERN
jgi:hypothetical protein